MKNILNKEKDVRVSVPPLSKPKMYVQHIHDAAEELYDLEAELGILEDRFAKKVAPKREFVHQAREKLLKMMQEARQKHIDVNESQFVYVRVPKTSFEVTDEVRAMKWAHKEGLVRIDKTAASKKLLRMVKLPQGFEEKRSESLTLKSTEK